MKKSESESSKNTHIEKALVENFISLQKVMANLSVKFDNLTEQITKLLEIFEISAKALAEKDLEKFQNSDNAELLKRLDNVLEQNKIIAKGLTLMHEKNFDSSEPVQEYSQPEKTSMNRFKSIPKY